MSQFRRILHASDFSPASRPAFRRALDLARANRAGLTLVHVYSTYLPVMGEGYVGGGQVYDKMIADIRMDAQRRLGRLVAEARKKGVRAKGLALGESPTTASCGPPDPRGPISSCSGLTAGPASAGSSSAASPRVS
jgi:nucleotide-binding universal stress UspA family protein